MTEIDYDALDPGIRDTVRLVNDCGFSTSDSGDGVTKPLAGWESWEALDYPHVVCNVTPNTLIREADRLWALLGDKWTVQASYDPRDSSAILFASIQKGI